MFISERAFEGVGQQTSNARFATTSKHTSLNTKSLILLTTPLIIQAVQLLLVIGLMSRLNALKVFEHSPASLELGICVFVGTLGAGFLFVASTLILSRSIVRKIQLIRQKIELPHETVQPFSEWSDWDELSDLSSDIDRLLERCSPSPADRAEALSQ